MDQFGASSSRIDVLIFALSAIGDSPVFESKLNELTPESEFSHVRAICHALMRYPQCRYAGKLEALLKAPGMSGWAQSSFDDVIKSNRPAINDTTVRNAQLKELYLAKALSKCAPENPLASGILREYAEGMQGVYAIFALL